MELQNIHYAIMNVNAFLYEIDSIMSSRSANYILLGHRIFLYAGKKLQRKMERYILIIEIDLRDQTLNENNILFQI